MAAYKGIMSGVTQKKRRNIEGQLNLFEMDEGADLYKDELPRLEEYSLKELLAYEKEVLGVYVSGNPLSEYTAVLNKYVNIASVDFLADNDAPPADNSEIVYGGMISAKTVKYTKTSGKAMAFLTVEDMYGAVEVVVFSKLYENYSSRLAEGAVILVSGRVSIKEEENGKIVANSIKFYDELKPEELWLKISKAHPVKMDLITDILSSHRGRSPVIIYDEARKQRFKAHENYWVDMSEPLIEELQDCLGKTAVKIRG
jgi:DNA polymerase-3 subunit alpha